MAALGINNQRIFAKKMGFKPTTVNAWMVGASLPSPDASMTLGRMAPTTDDSLFFFKQAGLTQEAIVSAANLLSAEQVRKPLPGECVNIQRVEKAPTGLKDLGRSILMPVELVPNPASTYCFGVSFTPGQFDRWAIVDTSDAEAHGLGPFWGLPVLMEFALSDQAPPLWPVGLEIGTLFLEEDEQNPDGTPWYARFLGPYPGGVSLGTSMRIGRWIESRQSRVALMLGLSEHDERVARPEGEGGAVRVADSIRSGRALREMRLAPGCKVIGRIITWWYGIQEPRKTNL